MRSETAVPRQHNELLVAFQQKLWQWESSLWVFIQSDKNCNKMKMFLFKVRLFQKKNVLDWKDNYFSSRDHIFVWQKYQTTLF